jgi:hypothetical protein
MSGKDSLRATGPHRMPEARDALRSGKLPRKAGMVLDANGMQFSLTFSPEGFAVGSAKLPEIEEADTPRVVFDERIALLRDLCKTLDAMFESFLTVRASSAWESKTAGVRRWIMQQTNKPVAAVA